MTFRKLNLQALAVLAVAALGFGCVTSNVESQKDAKSNYVISRPLSYGEMLTPDQKSQAEGMSHYAKALYLRSIGKDQEAQEHLLKAMAAHPESETVLKELVGPLMMAKKFDEALALLERVTSSTPASRPCNLVYSELLFLQGKKTEAIEFIRKCHEASPKEEVYAFQLVKYLLDQNQFDDLDELLQTLLTQPPYQDSIRWYSIYARLLVAASRQRDEAIPSYAESNDDDDEGSQEDTGETGADEKSAPAAPPSWHKYTEAELTSRINALFASLLALPITTPEELAEVGDILAFARRWKEMLGVIRRIEGQDGKLATSLPFLRMKLDALARCGEKEELGQFMEKLVSSENLSLPMAGRLADAFAEQKNYDMAIQMIELCLAQNKENFDLVWRLVTLYMANNEYDKAFLLLSLRESLPPAGSYLLGLIWKHKGDFRNAYKSMKVAEADHSLLNDSFFFNMAVICEQCGKIDEALDYARRAYETDKENPSNCNFYGYMLADHNRNLPTALKLLQKAVADEPQNPAYLDSIAWVHFRMKEYDKALDFIFKALEHNGLQEDPEGVIADHAGDICNARNLPALARFYWNVALHSRNKPADKARIARKLMAED